MPKTRLQFPDGDVLTIGTVSCDDQIHQAVYLGFTPAGSAAPTMELEIPPKSVDVIIQLLQNHANEARFVNGAPLVAYPDPYPVPASRDLRRKRKAGKGKTRKPEPGAGPSGSPAPPPADGSGSPGVAGAAE